MRKPAYQNEHLSGVPSQDDTLWDSRVGTTNPEDLGSLSYQHMTTYL
jgi:hypothetical protein